MRYIAVPTTWMDTVLSALCCECRYGIETGYLTLQSRLDTVCGKKESKLELASDIVRQVMLEFCAQKNVIILCDSWYVKQNLVSSWINMETLT